MIFRSIPTLLCNDGDLIKTQKFRNPKYVGDPVNAVRIFNEKQVDELIFLDITATKLNKKPDFELINEIASECFMPLSYGGGIKNISDMEKILSLGVEKIIVNNILTKNIVLIDKASKKFGSQFLVASIDFKKNIFGNYYIYNHTNKQSIEKNIEKYIKFISSTGVGEIYINNVDRDGMMNGFDVDLISRVVGNTNLPVVVCGGLKGLEDFQKAYNVGCSGASAGSYFIFQGKHRAVLISYPDKDAINKFIKNQL